MFTGIQNLTDHDYIVGTAAGQWLRCCATNRKVAGSIPAGVSGSFIDIKSFRSHYVTGFDSASNRNEYQGYIGFINCQTQLSGGRSMLFIT